MKSRPTKFAKAQSARHPPTLRPPETGMASKPLPWHQKGIEPVGHLKAEGLACSRS